MSEKSKNQGVDLSERLKDALPETYQSVVKEFQDCGFWFKSVDLAPGEVVLTFTASAYGQSDVECTMYALLLQKFNFVNLKVELCDEGGWPLARTYVAVAVPVQK